MSAEDVTRNFLSLWWDITRLHLNYNDIDNNGDTFNFFTYISTKTSIIIIKLKLRQSAVIPNVIHLLTPSFICGRKGIIKLIVL